MNKQETFDKVATHMLAQNARAIIPDTSLCAYRAEDGKTCAVGRLIPDNLYDKEFEEHDVAEIFDNYRELAEYLVPDDMGEHTAHEFFTVLQNIHDNTEVGEWETALRRTAQHYNLSTNAIANTIT